MEKRESPSTGVNLFIGGIPAVWGAIGFIELDKSKNKTVFIILIILYGISVLLWLIGFSPLLRQHIALTLCVFVLGIAAGIYGLTHKKPDDKDKKS